MKKTSEFVSPKHPDKICDFIADSILDAYLEKDKESRTAIEVMGGHNLITINGEVASKSSPNIEKLVKEIVGQKYKIIINIAVQSPEIAQGVDKGGAGDQGIMKGYATNETPEYLPLEYVLARNLCQKIYTIYPYDGKTQVTIENGKVLTVVASFQNTKNAELLKLVKKIIKADEYLINPAGEWTLGGFDADTGLSGRKLIIDNYGPQISIGGGSFSGKDATKVDRSGAYMARYVAKNLIASGFGKEVFVSVAYAIGIVEPLMLEAINEKGEDLSEIVRKNFDFRPRAIIKLLNLRKPIFRQTAAWGHFGKENLPWERIEKIKKIR
ncbi:methionine adenosyltransferase [Candidatus Nomurabacteria bacterium RIFCSPLOWO2_02_FULL_40_10]|uniref:Methionine adenosyltransferase n=2 Tax=Candidatus Nomuraibacteriota TaxID=1752729 RepID=A0A1F6XWA0_9BACT|nr:MAG: methionine adenosyltransferase [Candidatus Nomurabacteria bacterium RIFCSPHIGHO2_01_FULL_39_10]OGI98363.1 MAG: methionine adenosyltransferase [Candidatus Nomurabacteria bacterium RIFCSPLOWO2_02_FULL_40_10]